MSRLKSALRKGSPLRLVLLVLTVLAVLAVPAFLFGDRFEDQLDGAKALEFVRAQGPWSAAVGVGLIIADLVIPLPSPAVMAAMRENEQTRATLTEGRFIEVRNN